MRISARIDTAIHVLIELARLDRDEQESAGRMRSAALAEHLGVPTSTLDDLLSDLRRADLVASHRGPSGGWSIARPASEVHVADVIRGLEGPLATVRGVRIDELTPPDGERALHHMWIALRVQTRTVLEQVTIEDLVENRLDPNVEALTDASEAWQSRALRGAPPTTGPPPERR